MKKKSSTYIKDHFNALLGRLGLEITTTRAKLHEQGRLAHAAERGQLPEHGRYIPESPRRLAIMSRLIGYPRAEWVASKYRKLIPMGLRRLIG